MRIGIVGATGAGKTSLLKLLTRLYDVDAGAIRVDGVDVRTVPLPALRSRIGVVTQDVFLFDFGMGVDEHGRYRGHLKATGVRPKFTEKLADQGIRLGPEVFAVGAEGGPKAVGR